MSHTTHLYVVNALQLHRATMYCMRMFQVLVKAFFRNSWRRCAQRSGSLLQGFHVPLRNSASPHEGAGQAAHRVSLYQVSSSLDSPALLPFSCQHPAPCPHTPFGQFLPASASSSSSFFSRPFQLHLLSSLPLPDLAELTTLSLWIPVST